MQNKKKNSIYKTSAIASLITLIGFFFLSYNYIEAKKIVAYDYMANMFYNGREIVKKEEIKEKQETQEKQEIREEEEKREELKEEPLPEEISNEYIGYLVIPKINLMKGFLDIRSTENDVEKNILVVEGSNYPTTDKGNFILAGHSGTGWKAFFNDLYKLSINDTVYVTYKNKKYIYQIVNIYTQPKTGKIAIYRNYEKTTLTLITCTNTSTTSQTVYIAELISIEE